jgi:DNA-directed RNA polymerase specialized sigma24 family protein
MREYSKLEDAVKAFRGGDYGAFEEIFEGTCDTLYIYARCAADTVDAEAILRVAYMRIARSMGRLEDPTALMLWSRRIVVSAAAAYVRRSGRTSGSASVDSAKTLNEAVRIAVMDLPLQQAVSIVGRYIDDLRISEIAYMTGVSESAVNGRLRTARNTVKEQAEKFAQHKGIDMPEASPAKLVIDAMNGITDLPEYSLSEDTRKSIVEEAIDAARQSDMAKESTIHDGGGFEDALKQAYRKAAEDQAEISEVRRTYVEKADEEDENRPEPAWKTFRERLHDKKFVRKLIIAAVAICVVIVGGNAIHNEMQRRSDAAALRRLDNQRAEARLKFSDDLRGQLGIKLEDADFSSEQKRRLTSVYVGDHDGDKVPELIIYGLTDISSSMYSTITYNDHLSIYYGGDVYDFGIYDVVEKTVSEESPIVYVSKDRTKFTIVIASGTGDKTYRGVRYEFKNNKYKVTAKELDSVSISDDNYNSFRDTYMPKKFTKYDPTSGKNSYKTFTDYDGEDYLALYGVNVRMTKTKYSGWKDAYKKFFESDSKIDVLGADSVKIAVRDINSDGVPEVFVSSEDSYSSTGRVQCFTYAGHRVIELGGSLNAKASKQGLTSKRSKIFLYGKYEPGDGSSIDRAYVISVNKSGFIIDRMYQSAYASGSSVSLPAMINWRENNTTISDKITDLQNKAKKIDWSKTLSASKARDRLTKELDDFGNKNE